MEIKVGLFNDSYPPVMDGVSNTVQNYAYWINKKYGKGVVITPRFPKYKDVEDHEVIRYYSTKLPLRPPYRLGMATFDFQTQRLLNSTHFDIIHVHSPFSSGQLALKIAKRNHVPIIATFHSKFYDDFKQALKSNFLAKVAVKRVITFFEKVDYVWTVNERTAETLRGYGYKGKIEIMPNGTEFINDLDAEENRSILFEQYQIETDRPILLFVGQHIWQKNIRLIIETLSDLKKSGDPFKMIFIGDGYAKEEIQKYVKELGLQNDIQFIGKLLDRELLKRFYLRADLFLFPSIYDNAPIVVKEAAALCTASVVVQGANAQEGITHLDNGFVCEATLASLKSTIKLALSDPERLSQIGKRAQETLAVSWEDVVALAFKRYREIIDEHITVKNQNRRSR